MKQTIANNLKGARTRAGQTQEQIARETAIDRRRLSDLERGVHKPNPQERERLISTGLLDPEARHEERAERAYKSKWRQKRQTMYRKSTYSVEHRLNAAVKIFGSAATQRLRALGEGEVRDAYLHFLSNAVVDSGLEMYAWLSLAAGKARPVWLSPASVGFRKWAVVNPGNLEVVSDIRFPALEFQIGDVPAIAFPQLTVIARSAVYRLDALLGLRVGRSRIWIDLEIDGVGHEARFDAEREQRLDLPAVRVSTIELRDVDIYELLEDKLRANKLIA